MTEGNAGGPPKGSHVVQHFKVALAVKPDAVQGVNVNVDLGAAAWAGHSRVTLDVTWKDVKKVPWKNMDFLLSSRVRSTRTAALRLLSALPRHRRRRPATRVVPVDGQVGALSMGVGGASCWCNSDVPHGAASHRSEVLRRVQACDDQAVTTPQDVFHPDGKFSYKWPFEPFSKGEGKKKVKKRMQLHMYKNTVLTLAEAQCAVIVDVSSNPPTLLGAGAHHG